MARRGGGTAGREDRDRDRNLAASYLAWSWVPLDMPAQRALRAALGRLQGASVETALGGEDLHTTFATPGGLLCLCMLVLRAAARGADPEVLWRERCAAAVPVGEALAAVRCVQSWCGQLRGAEDGAEGHVSALRAAVEAAAT